VDYQAACSGNTQEALEGELEGTLLSTHYVDIMLMTSCCIATSIK
jgi:hypothetical protein